jgi:hypothetical protein
LQAVVSRQGERKKPLRSLTAKFEAHRSNLDIHGCAVGHSSVAVLVIKQTLFGSVDVVIGDQG